MLTFLRALTQQLDDEIPGWRANCLCLLDGAKYHTSPEMRRHLEKLGLPVVYTAPYSYTSSPIELLFSALKMGELNPEGKKTGKS